MSDIQGQIVLAENSAGNGLQRLKLNSSGLLRVISEATSVSANQIDLNTDGLEALQAAMVTDLAAIEVINTNAEVHLGNIDTGVDVLEACVGSNKVNVNISSGNITGFATASNQSTIIGHIDGVESSLTAITGYVDGIEGKQDTMIGHMDGVEGLLGTIDSDTDAIKTSTAAMVVDLAAIEVINTNAEVHLGNIDTGVDVLEACVGSNKVNVNISSGNISGFATSALQGDMETSLDAILAMNTLGEAHLGNIDTGVDVLEACVGSNKMNVNISSGNISGFATSALQGDMETTLDAILAKNSEIETTNNANQVLLGTIDSDTDAIKTSTAALVVDLAAIEVINTNAEVHLGNIDTGVDVLEACVGSNKVNVNISSGNISGFSTATKQDAMITDLAAIEVLLTQANSNQGTLDTSISDTTNAIDTMDAVLDQCLVKQSAMVVDLAAIEVLHTATNQKLDDIETAVQLIDDAIKTEDLAHSSGDKGIPCLMVRQDSHSDLAADGDYMIPTINANGEIRVTSTAASGGATESKQDTMIGHIDGIETLIGSTNSKIDTFDAVLDASLVKQTNNETLLTAQNALITTIDGVLDTIKVDTEAIETAVEKLSGVSEAVWLNNATINAQALGASLDTTGYTKVRLYGVVDQSFFSGVSDLLVMGSLTDGGVYFNLGAAVTNEVGASNGASVQTLNCLLESPPKFIKIKNDSGSDNYAMTINAKMTHT